MTLEFPCDPATVVGWPSVLEASMIQITPQMRILLAVEPVDFRRGIDGLAALCRQALVATRKPGRCSSSGRGVATPSSA
ncbi:MAG: hypothetical protein HS113_24830 [Verrucomicrobiales bacterium]|nr:hypothetical protein [Verrucomicrobiales bacterium]